MQLLAPTVTPSCRMTRPSCGISITPAWVPVAPKPASPMRAPAYSFTRSPIRAKPTLTLAPITQSRPIWTPGAMTLLAPMRDPRPMRTPEPRTTPGSITTLSSSIASPRVIA